MIPMDSIDLDSVLINHPFIEKLDTVQTKSARPQNSTGSKSTVQHRLTGGCLGKGHCHCVDPGAIVEEKFHHPSTHFQKAKDAKPKQPRLPCSHQRTQKTKTNREKLPTAGLHSL
jgi:hypothetical protein